MSLRIAPALLLGCLLATTAATSGQTADEIASVRRAIAEGRYRDAAAAAELLVAAYPGAAPPLVWLGHAYRLGGDSVAATRAYLRAREIDPDDPEMLMGLGELQEAAGDYDAAVESYERVIAISPGPAAPYRRAGSVRMRLEDHARAAEYFAAYLERQPGDLQVMQLLGVAQYLAQDYDAAISVFEQALQLAPDDIPAAYGLGVVLAQRPDQYDRALELLRRAAKAGWEASNSWYLIGRILSDQADFEAAVPALERSLELDPDQLDGNYRLAQALVRLGRREEARRYSERFRTLQQQHNASEADIKKLRTLRNALTEALRTGDLEQTQTLLNQMLAVDPDDPATLLQAAKVWMSTGDDAGATDAVVAALQLDADNWEGLYLRGLLLSKEGNLEAAREALELSLRGNSLFADTQAALGNVYLQMNDAAAAVAAYLAAVDLEPDNPGYHLNLAAAYARQGRSDLEQQAMETYRRLLQQQSQTQS